MTPKEIETLTAKGKAEAVEIIKSLDPEDAFENCIGSYPIADTGDYGYEWKTEKLNELFGVGKALSESPISKTLENLEAMYWKQVSKQDDFDIFKKLVKGLVAQIDSGIVSQLPTSDLSKIRSWIK